MFSLFPMLSLAPLTSRSQLPVLSIPCLYLILIGTLALPYGRYRGILSILLALYIYHLLNFTTGSPVSDYATGSAIAQVLFKFVDFVILSNAEAEFWRVCHPLAENVEVATDVDQHRVLQGDIYQGSSRWQEIWKKVRWAFGLSVTARGIGWSWQVKHIPQSSVARASQTKIYFLKPFSRSLLLLDLLPCTFIFTNIFRAIWFFILIRIRAMILTAIPASSFNDESVIIQTLLCFVYGAQIAFGLNITYAIAAVATVSLGLCEPCDWPPAFGSFADAYTLRRFWGRTWHQMERRIVSKFGILVARRALHFPPGSFASRYIQLYVAFFISGLIHYFGGIFACRKGLNELRFFMAQAVAITAEDAFIGLAGLRGYKGKFPRWVERGAGYLWVSIWLSYSLRLYVGKLAEQNIWV